MLLKRDEGCINCGYISLDEKGFEYLTEEEKQDIWIKLLENLEEQYSENNCFQLINWYINNFGNYNYLYHCDQCGDDVGESIVEI